jgi:25S rRNA (uracil2634-N3)-methyltransferase
VTGAHFFAGSQSNPQPHLAWPPSPPPRANDTSPQEPGKYIIHHHHHSMSNSNNNKKKKKRPFDNAFTPVRDCSGPLYASSITIACAFTYCVPCCYKIATMDVALDTEFCRIIPNQRPEVCPRQESLEQYYNTSPPSSSGPAPAATNAAVVLGFAKSMTVLTVGDGDLSYSVALTRIGCTVVATCFESKKTLQDVYGGSTIDSNIVEIQSATGGMVEFGVNALELSKTLPASHTNVKFDRIIWNFPCAAVAQGQDGQNQEMELNKQLIRMFAANAVPMLNRNGQIHINHKTKPPFNQWNIEQEVLAGGNEQQQLVYLGRIVLDRALLPPYTPRKALDRKSFPHHDACTYIFSKIESPSETTTMKKTMENAGGILVAASTDTLHDDQLANTVVPVTPDLIYTLRTNFLIVKSRYDHTHEKRSKRRVKKAMDNANSHNNNNNPANTGT